MAALGLEVCWLMVTNSFDTLQAPNGARSLEKARKLSQQHQAGGQPTLGTAVQLCPRDMEEGKKDDFPILGGEKKIKNKNSVTVLEANKPTFLEPLRALGQNGRSMTLCI